MDDPVDTLLDQWHQQRPELDVTGLSVAVRVELVAKLLRRGTEKALAKIGLKSWQYDVLSALRRQGPPFELPATELARASFLSSGAMTTRIDNLETQGFVERYPDPNDRRGVRVRLTASGRKIVDAALQARLTAAQSGIRALSARERKDIESSLRKVLLALAPEDGLARARLRANR
jgi:DNA-binding MarR family transcriptional regulator